MDGDPSRDENNDATSAPPERHDVAEPVPTTSDAQPGASALTREDLTIATLIGARITHARIGEMLGLSTKSVQRRVGKPGMARAIAEARGARLEALTASALAVGNKAFAVIERVMDSDDERVALSAAKTGVSAAYRLGRADADADLEARVLNLEAATEAPDQRRRRRPSSAEGEEE